jgi:sporulation-control protein
LVFKKMLSALGVGGPSVDTVLDGSRVRPGESLRGHVHIVGGKNPAEIEHVALGLVTRVEVESGDHEYDTQVEFHRMPVAGAITLAPDEQQAIPFRFPVPWETPITSVYGQHLRGMTMGLRTELSVAGAIDKSDLDPVAIDPLPAQERILAAFGELGFQFMNADLERGHLRGVHQRLPFYQEIEFYPPSYARGINEIEVTFVAAPLGMDVILEVDKRGGVFSSGRDAYGHLRVDYATAAQTDWTAQVDKWFRGTLQRRPAGLGARGFGQL